MLFGRKKEYKKPMDQPPPFEELVAPEPPPKAVQKEMPSSLPDLGDLSLPSLDEEFKPLKPSFALPLEEETFPEPEFKPMAGPYFPEIPKEPELEEEILPQPPKPKLKIATEQLKGTAEANFINVQDYIQLRAWLEDIDQDADIGEDTVYRLNELDQEAEKHYQRFGTSLEAIQRKLITADKIMFKG